MNKDPKNYYKTLEIPIGSDMDTVKKSWRALSKKYHPDLNEGKKEYVEKLKEINEAYYNLKDPEKKERYDRGVYGNGENFFNFNSKSFDFSNIFNSFENFGTFDNFFSSEFNTKLNITISLTISLKEGFKGCNKKIKYSVRELCYLCDGLGAQKKDLIICNNCKGRGKIYSKKSIFGYGYSTTLTLCSFCKGTGNNYTIKCYNCKGKKHIIKKEERTIKIPRGVTNNTILIIKHEGHSEKNTRGDLKIKINMNNDGNFQIYNEYDLISEINVPLRNILRKELIKIDLITGTTRNIVLNSIKKNITIIKLSSEGYINKNGKRGDLYVKTNILIPKLTDEEIEKLKSLNIDKL